MDSDYAISIIRLALALGAGALIGLERTYHGRPAGFRTHALVCTASALLMLLTVFYTRLIPDASLGTLQIDPTRMAQGIMTGIGFLGAGVVIKEGLTVRGLTTAASIWMSAAIGITIGVGLYFPALVAEVIAFGTLALFRWIEALVPGLKYGRLAIQFHSGKRLPETELGRLIAQHGMTYAGLTFSLDDQSFKYEMTIRTRHANNFERLADTLCAMESVKAFSITPTGD